MIFVDGATFEKMSDSEQDNYVRQMAYWTVHVFHWDWIEDWPKEDETMPGFNEKCCKMPQFKGLSGGPHKLPDLPMEGDISGQGNQLSGKSNNSSAYTAHKSRATMGSKTLSK